CQTNRGFVCTKSADVVAGLNRALVDFDSQNLLQSLSDFFRRDLAVQTTAFTSFSGEANSTESLDFLRKRESRLVLLFCFLSDGFEVLFSLLHGAVCCQHRQTTGLQVVTVITWRCFDYIACLAKALNVLLQYDLHSFSDLQKACLYPS